MARQKSLLSWFYRGNKLVPARVGLLLVALVVVAGLLVQLNNAGYLKSAVSAIPTDENNASHPVCVSGSAVRCQVYEGQCENLGYEVQPDLSCGDLYVLEDTAGSGTSGEFKCPSGMDRFECGAAAQTVCAEKLASKFLLDGQLCPNNQKPEARPVADVLHVGTDSECAPGDQNCQWVIAKCSQYYGCYPLCADFNWETGQCMCGNQSPDTGDPWNETRESCPQDFPEEEDATVGCADMDSEGRCL